MFGIVVSGVLWELVGLLVYFLGECVDGSDVHEVLFMYVNDELVRWCQVRIVLV